MRVETSKAEFITAEDPDDQDSIEVHLRFHDGGAIDGPGGDIWRYPAVVHIYEDTDLNGLHFDFTEWLDRPAICDLGKFLDSGRGQDQLEKIIDQAQDMLLEGPTF